MQIKMIVRESVVAGVLAGSLAFSGTLAGGEAIQFSSDKTKPVAATDNPLTKDRLTPKNKLSGISPLDGAGVDMMRNDSRRRFDPKEERRLDNKKLEDENWMILNEGDLQAQDDYDEVYGRNDFDPDKKRKSSDIWFATKQGETAREPGTLRSRNSVLRAPAQNRPQDGASRDEDKDTSFSFARRLGKEADTKSERGQSREAGAQGAVNQNLTDSALKDLFNTGNGSTRGFDDRSRGRSEPGLRSFDAPEGKASSLGSSFGFGQSGVSGPSMKDSAFRPAGSPSLPSLGAGPFGGGARDTFSLRPTGPATPLQPQPPADSSLPSTRGTFDVPSRPGFGR